MRGAVHNYTCVQNYTIYDIYKSVVDFAGHFNLCICVNVYNHSLGYFYTQMKGSKVELVTVIVEFSVLWFQRRQTMSR